MKLKLSIFSYVIEDVTTKQMVIEMSRYQHSDPYQEGYDAFWQGVSENPYSDADNSELWGLGHEHAEDEYWKEVEDSATFVGEF